MTLRSLFRSSAAPTVYVVDLTRVPAGLLVHYSNGTTRLVPDDAAAALLLVAQGPGFATLSVPDAWVTAQDAVGATLDIPDAYVESTDATSATLLL